MAASKALTTAAVLAGFDRDAERLGVDSVRLFVSEEAHEGMLAFLQKTPTAMGRRVSYLAKLADGEIAAS